MTNLLILLELAYSFKLSHHYMCNIFEYIIARRGGDDC